MIDIELVRKNLMWDYILVCFGINPRNLTPSDRGKIESMMFAMADAITEDTYEETSSFGCSRCPYSD